MQNYQTEFPQFTGPMPVFDGFEDCSWHNDVCPSFQFPLGGNSFLRVWVNFADPKDREWPLLERFSMDLNHEDDYYTILRTDDLELVQFVCDLIKKGKKPGVPTFLCKWDDLFEMHTEQSLRDAYGDTNLFETDATWDADGEPDFEIVLRKLKTGRYDWNSCDNMTIYRVSPKGVL